MTSQFTIEFDLDPFPNLLSLLEEIGDDYDIEYDGPEILCSPVKSDAPAGSYMRAFNDDNQAYPIVFTAPIDLRAGDECLIQTTTGRLLAVKRPPNDFVYIAS